MRLFPKQPLFEYVQVLWKALPSHHGLRIRTGKQVKTLNFRRVALLYAVMCCLQNLTLCREEMDTAGIVAIDVICAEIHALKHLIKFCMTSGLRHDQG